MRCYVYELLCLWVLVSVSSCSMSSCIFDLLCLWVLVSSSFCVYEFLCLWLHMFMFILSTYLLLDVSLRFLWIIFKISWNNISFLAPIMIHAVNGILCPFFNCKMIGPARVEQYFNMPSPFYLPMIVILAIIHLVLQSFAFYYYSQVMYKKFWEKKYLNKRFIRILITKICFARFQVQHGLC
jgi:hypothetical protein